MYKKRGLCTCWFICSDVVQERGLCRCWCVCCDVVQERGAVYVLVCLLRCCTRKGAV
ncbi:hypothetical protein NP493_1980g00014 [Ridgeia piscesae]|uniref:Uncharacterized protein n=1 Tax=Ridgeia piscesae TaxID=27915 RepID=A0AAD9N3Z5_RIDPI|nr:hypothetical protein NP493_1980g00014 [Ridgeia piscesae]